MPYSVSLKYKPPYDRLETEEQLSDILLELKVHYPLLTKNFELMTATDKPVETFKNFLTYALKKSYLKLKCIKNVSDLDIIDEIAEFDLSDLRLLTWDWNKKRDGTCPGCTNSESKLVQYGLTQVTCKIMEIGKRKSICPSYDAKLKNAEGKPARRLEKIVEEYID
jgi:hypothetical protein